MSHPVVSEKMRYGLKPIAVESKAHILSIGCQGTNIYDGNTSSTIIFRVNHNPGGRYIDPAGTRFRLNFTLNLPVAISPADCFLFDRGPESIIRRLQVKDVQGRVLEDIDQYNMVYAITEICTNDSMVRDRRGMFHMESAASNNGTGLANTDTGGWIRHWKHGFHNGYSVPSEFATTTGAVAQTVSFDVTFTPLSAVFGGACDKYLPLSVMEGIEIHLQLETPANCIKYQFVPFSSANASGLASVSAGLDFATNSAAPVQAVTKFITSRIAPVSQAAALTAAQTFSTLCTASLTATDGTIGYGLSAAAQQSITYTVKNPVLLLSCLDVEPSVNAVLINAAKDPRDGMIRIQTFSWMTTATSILGSQLGEFSWVIPVNVTSLKSIFFTFTNTSTLNNMNYLKTGFEHRGILNYHFRVGGLPLNADVTTVDDGLSSTLDTYALPVDALMAAWSVNHKTDGNPSLLTRANYAPAQFDVVTGLYQRERNAIFGQELESFSQKSGIIQSGINTMQTTFQLVIQFGQSNTKSFLIAPPSVAVTTAVSEPIPLWNPTATYELRAYCMYDKVIAFDNESGSIRSEY
jgi:hypothetical protein